MERESSTVPPVTTTHGFPEGWWNADGGYAFAMGRLEAWDDESGVSRLNAFISVNGGPEEPMTDRDFWDWVPEGVCRVRFWAEDGAGNVETEKVAYWRSDYTPPECSLTSGVSALITGCGRALRREFHILAAR